MESELSGWGMLTQRGICPEITMKIATRFEELEIWTAAQELAVKLYGFFGPDSPAARDYSYVGQIRSAVVSVSNNISEGFECPSALEFRRFLVIAKRSCGEVRSMLWLAPRLGYVSSENGDKLRSEAEVLSRRISAFMRTLKV